MSRMRLIASDSRREDRKRIRAREGRVSAHMLVGLNHEHFLELSTTTHPFAIPMSEQNIVEVENAIALFRERVAQINLGPDVLFARTEVLVVS